jgi:transcriptional regulator with XRE-family HTH domain
VTDVCQLLRETRLSKGLTLEEVAQRTYIKLHYLEALEEGRVDRLPAMVHTYGYIRQYAKLLGLDGGALVAQFQQLERGSQMARPPKAAHVEAPPENLSFLRPLKSPYTNGNGAAAVGTSAGLGGNGRPASTMDPEFSASRAIGAALPIDKPHVPVTGEMTPTPQHAVDLMEARTQAQQIVLAAEREARQLVRGAEGYADDVLAGLESEVSAVLQIIQNGRQFLASRRRAGTTREG